MAMTVECVRTSILASASRFRSASIHAPFTVDCGRIIAPFREPGANRCLRASRIQVRVFELTCANNSSIIKGMLDTRGDGHEHSSYHSWNPQGRIRPDL